MHDCLLNGVLEAASGLPASGAGGRVHHAARIVRSAYCLGGIRFRKKRFFMSDFDPKQTLDLLVDYHLPARGVAGAETMPQNKAMEGAGECTAEVALAASP